jgi:hypothetical protein
MICPPTEAYLNNETYQDVSKTGEEINQQIKRVYLIMSTNQMHSLSSVLSVSGMYEVKYRVKLVGMFFLYYVRGGTNKL